MIDLHIQNTKLILAVFLIVLYLLNIMCFIFNHYYNCEIKKQIIKQCIITINLI